MEVAHGDLEDRASLRAAVQGARAVVHLAGRAHLRGQRGPEALHAFRRINVQGTLTLLEESIAAGVEQYLFVSTVGAVATCSVRAIDDSSPPHPDTPYGISKLEAELEVLRAVRDRGIRIAILRPAMVFGPGMKGNPLRLFRLVDSGIPLPLGSVENQRSFAFVGSVAQAILSILESPSRNPGPYLLADSPPISTPHFIRAIAAALAVRDPLVRCPAWSLRAAGVVGEALGRLLPFPLDRDAVNRLVGSLAVESDALARETEYAQTFSLEEGLRLTAAWFRVERTQ
jgi:nucleoside-diphosphate-sugar epimerase